MKDNFRVKLPPNKPGKPKLKKVSTLKVATIEKRYRELRRLRAKISDIEALRDAT